MADINVERKGPSIWPWIIGLLVLALLIWAIAEMVDTDEEQVAQVEEVQEPVAVAPTPTPAPVTPEGEAVELTTLAPLGSDDVGRTVRVQGEVIGQPTDQGIWIQTQINGQPHAIFAQTPVQTEGGQMLDATTVRSGQTIVAIATLQQAPSDQATTWIEESQLRQEPDFQRMNVHQDLMLSSTQAGLPQPGTQQRGMQQDTQPQSGDTTQGMY